MCVAVIVGCALTLIVTLWVWLEAANVEALVVPRLGLAHVPVALDLPTRLTGLAVSMIPVLVLFYMLHQAYQLFSAYRHGNVFTAKAPVQLRRIGLGLVVLAFVRPLRVAALAALLTASNPPGERIVSIGFSLDDFMLAALGGLILVIGHVMVEAKRLADESREIV
jgi:hypothetical protein